VFFDAGRLIGLQGKLPVCRGDSWHHGGLDLCGWTRRSEAVWTV